jgi:hypothetical protein
MEILFACLWIVTWSNGDWACNNQTLPVLSRVESEQLINVLYGENVSKLSPDQWQYAAESLDGVYDNDRNIIYLHSRVDLESASGMSYLVHELIHYIQYDTGKNKSAKCMHALEYDAYIVQNSFMVSYGQKPDVDPFTIAMRSMCEN